jgi:hypothetical protein
MPRQAIRYARLALIPIALGLFCKLFNPAADQRWVDGLWLVAVLLWIVEVRHLAGGSLPPPRVAWADAWPIAVLILLLATVWLPFYNNWRWAYTSDSVAWFGAGAIPAVHGLSQNILSLRGVDNNFTYLHGLAFNSLLFVFGPTLFWHRVGKLIVSCLALTSIYAFFTRMVGRWWAAAVIVCVAFNSVWLWFSYVSYGHMDSYIFYFSTLILAHSIWRHPDRLGLWMLCGLVGGLSMFFTQTAWSAVIAVGLVLGVFAIVSRRFVPLAVYAVSFLLLVIPILLQFPDLLAMTTRQAKSIYDWDYLGRIFSAIMWLPYRSEINRMGVRGAFLRPPLGALYLIGLLVAALTLVPPVRRRLRLPVVVPLILGLLLWDTVLMTLTNNGYGQPSTKRCYNLIPLQVFLALLPLYAVHVRLAGWKWLGRGVIGITALAMGAYAVANLLLIIYPTFAWYGVNVFDAMIELRQRFPDRRVVLFSSRGEIVNELLRPDGLYTQSYHLGDTVTSQHQFTSEALQAACAAQAIICYEPKADATAMKAMVDPMRDRMREFPILNADEVRCFECEPAGAAPS